MKKAFQNLANQHPFLKIFGNRYILVLLFFTIWMLFLDNYSYLEHRVLNKEIDELEDNKQYYQEEIRKDNSNIKKLSNPAQVEKYAREKYYMKRENEDIYIIEFEDEAPEEGAE